MDRPIFNSIMKKVRAGASGGIAVYKLDRFARSVLGAISTLAELGEHGAVLASATEPELDYTTPAGRAFLQQMFVFAEFTRSTLKKVSSVSTPLPFPVAWRVPSPRRRSPRSRTSRQ
jgi:site-specific DNA recombinase